LHAGGERCGREAGGKREEARKLEEGGCLETPFNPF
jgi:hypothetical protein